ncbi:hypothetical protein FEM48_Zijuj09G0015900 [Ziziphus jujuba var. spinosa]|uniref:Heparan-alpha-glucosaminide N-acetyltransferase-like n=1 Tax=Ziziphus jujuba var. spinosa TaxID=714518 RepID=A0A978UQ53_ZIZJJ|nr:hypothetical protein FEM48_Zijuj09G0015900 [Ziziphus jujuba var. spinosa]
MASVIAMAEEQGAGDPLLQHSYTDSSNHHNEEDIVPFLSSNGPDASRTTPNQRLVSLDVFRGLTVAKISSKASAMKKVMLRSMKLFLFGLLLQGGYFHGRHNLTYGVDVHRIRWLGVLQRISIGYLLASVSEIWLVSKNVVDSPRAFARKYYIQWLFAIVLCSIYMLLSYGLYVPNWRLAASSANMSAYPSYTQTVHCEVRGSLQPPCNAVGLIDRTILGEHHLYQRPVYRRTKECSVNSPDYGPLPTNSPVWCLAPFDPEGILSSLMAAITCFLGLHYGHILVHCKGQMERLLLWSIFSISLLTVGYILEILGMYVIHYLMYSGTIQVDVKHFRKPMMLLQWMGMNALIVYALAACDLFPAALQGFYWESPENNLVDGTQTLLQTMLHSRKWGTLAFVTLEILFWGLFAGFLHTKGIYMKL